MRPTEVGGLLSRAVSPLPLQGSTLSSEKAGPSTVEQPRASSPVPAEPCSAVCRAAHVFPFGATECSERSVCVLWREVRPRVRYMKAPEVCSSFSFNSERGKRKRWTDLDWSQCLVISSCE